MSWRQDVLSKKKKKWKWFWPFCLSLFECNHQLSQLREQQDGWPELCRGQTASAQDKNIANMMFVIFYYWGPCEYKRLCSFSLCILVLAQGLFWNFWTELKKKKKWINCFSYCLEIHCNFMKKKNLEWAMWFKE